MRERAAPLRCATRSAWCEGARPRRRGRRRRRARRRPARRWRRGRAGCRSPRSRRGCAIPTRSTPAASWAAKSWPRSMRIPARRARPAGARGCWRPSCGAFPGALPASAAEAWLERASERMLAGARHRPGSGAHLAAAPARVAALVRWRRGAQRRRAAPAAGRDQGRLVLAGAGRALRADRQAPTASSCAATAASPWSTTRPARCRSTKDVESGLAAQLPLEAAIAAARRLSRRRCGQPDQVAAGARVLAPLRRPR